MSILHFGQHHKDTLRREVLEFSEEMGSKGGILEYLRTFPDLKDHILPGFSVSHEVLSAGGIPDLPRDFQERETALIYRSSHPDDHRGYIDMLPTLLSRRHTEEKYRSPYELLNHDLNLLKVYNALGYYQVNGIEQICTGRDLHIDGFYNPYGFPLSDSRQSYETKEQIPHKEFAQFFDIGQYGYHIDYHQFYLSKLEKVKSGEDTTDYSQKAQRITDYKGWDYREMIKRVQDKIRVSRGYLENTGLRGMGEAGIYIQPEVLSYGETVGGIYESPHKKGVYIITFRTPSVESDNERKKHPDRVYAFADIPTTIIYDSSNGEINEIEGDAYGRLAFLETVLELYKKVANKELFGIDYSFHMEFGFDGGKPLIYQIRQFSPYQEAGFKVDEIEQKKKHVIRGITDEVGEKVNITLLGDESSLHAGMKNDVNIAIKYRKVELNYNIPLRARRLVTGTGYGRLDNDHGLTKFLYETGGIALAGKLPGRFPDRDDRKRQTYTGTLFSDGTNIAFEGIEKVDD